jgi:hypothetical protein
MDFSDRTMALGSTQPLVKMSTRNIPVGKGGRCVRLTTSPPSRAECHEIWKRKPPGTLWATPGLLRDSFSFYILHVCKYINKYIYLYVYKYIYHNNGAKYSKVKEPKKIQREVF